MHTGYLFESRFYNRVHKTCSWTQEVSWTKRACFEQMCVKNLNFLWFVNSTDKCWCVNEIYFPLSVRNPSVALSVRNPSVALSDTNRRNKCTKFSAHAFSKTFVGCTRSSKKVSFKWKLINKFLFLYKSNI